jgi:hypothetical protein
MNLEDRVNALESNMIKVFEEIDGCKDGCSVKELKLKEMQVIYDGVKGTMEDLKKGQDLLYSRMNTNIVLILGSTLFTFVAIIASLLFGSLKFYDDLAVIRSEVIILQERFNYEKK